MRLGGRSVSKVMRAWHRTRRARLTLPADGTLAGPEFRKSLGTWRLVVAGSEEPVDEPPLAVGFDSLSAHQHSQQRRAERSVVLLADARKALLCAEGQLIKGAFVRFGRGVSGSVDTTITVSI
jgi:hypothetical protein